MVTKEGMDYIQQQLAAGLDQANIKQAMVAGGWQESDVDEMLAQTVKASTSVNQIGNTKKTPKVLLIIILIILVLVGAYFIFLSPSRVFARLIANSSKISSFGYTLNINGQVGAPKIENQIITLPSDSASYFALLNADGQVDTGNLSSQKLIANINLLTSQGGGEQQVTNGQLIFANGTVYIKVDQLPEISEVDLSTLIGKWITFPQEKATFTNNNLKWIDLYKTNNFMVANNRPKLSFTNGKITYHYSLSLDKNKFQNFLTEYQNTSNQEDNVSNQSELSPNFPDFSAEIWVGVFDANLYYLTFDLLPQSSDSGTVVDGKFSGAIGLMDYGKKVDLTIPDNPLDGQQVMQMIEAQMATDLVADTDNDGLPNYYEKLWGTDSNKPDTDGDGYGDGKEVCNGFDPLTNNKINDNQKDLPKPGSCQNLLNNPSPKPSPSATLSPSTISSPSPSPQTSLTASPTS